MNVFFGHSFTSAVSRWDVVSYKLKYVQGRDVVNYKLEYVQVVVANCLVKACPGKVCLG